MLNSCGKQKTKPVKKTAAAPSVVKPGKLKKEKPVALLKAVKKTVPTVPSNLIFNPSFEKGRAFDLINKKDKSAIEKPDGWVTNNQLLSESMGWCSTKAHSGKRSLEITKTADKEAYWQGLPVKINNDEQLFFVSGWSMINKKGVKSRLKYKITFADKSSKDYLLDIKDNYRKWNKAAAYIYIPENKKALSITPYCVLDSTGTAWFDDIMLKAVDTKSLKFSNNLVHNDGWKPKNQDKSVYSFDDEVKFNKSNTLKIDCRKMNVFYSWSGTFIKFKSPVNSISVSGWNSTENITGSGSYGLSLAITFEDGSYQCVSPRVLFFTQASHDWENVRAVLHFDKNIKIIVPEFYVFGAITGTFRFSDFSIKSVSNL